MIKKIKDATWVTRNFGKFAYVVDEDVFVADTQDEASTETHKHNKLAAFIQQIGFEEEKVKHFLYCLDFAEDSNCIPSCKVSMSNASGDQIQSVNAIIDTGCSVYGTISPSTIQKLGISYENNKSDLTGTHEGNKHFPQVRLPKLTLMHTASTCNYQNTTFIDKRFLITPRHVLGVPFLREFSYFQYHANDGNGIIFCGSSQTKNTGNRGQYSNTFLLVTVCASLFLLFRRTH